MICIKSPGHDAIKDNLAVGACFCACSECIIIDLTFLDSPSTEGGIIEIQANSALPRVHDQQGAHPREDYDEDNYLMSEKLRQTRRVDEARMGALPGHEAAKSLGMIVRRCKNGANLKVTSEFFGLNFDL